ncbi:P-loop containing nucleoside triphosphate hydrolase protein [Gigaspora margarita]|uniref:P-loop containing nucleoside triphosphate hydrolase protein n=1 Tax=Gigaspora margarita TaxID=4874 RepID=A0A8H4AE77_GIGMA|nr:P-loop containing nucleoside triphosphate hydrolase protein [Gigaspora margarita]
MDAFTEYVLADIQKVQSLWNKTSNGEKAPLSLSSLSSLSSSSSPSSSILGKRQRDSDIINPSLIKKQCIIPVMSYFCSDIDIPLQANGSVNILKVNVKVPRESTYDAEMYRILHNWLAKVHGFEITGQWHLEGISDDGNYHYSYCDLTIKKPESPNPEAVIEVLATGSIPKLAKHLSKF